MQNSKINKGIFNKFLNDKKDDGEIIKNENRKEEEKKENKKEQNLKFEKEEKKVCKSPRLLWKKRKQADEQNKKNILELYSGNTEKEENVEKQNEGNGNVIKEEKEKQYPKSPNLKIKKFHFNSSCNNWFLNQEEKSEKIIYKEIHDGKKNENEEFEEENIEETLDNILLGEENEEFECDSIEKGKKLMSKIPGVSENLYNQINKKINSILERCKIPVFNVEEYIYDKKLGEGGYAVIFSVYKIDDKSGKEYAMKKIISQSLNEIDKFTKEFELVYSCVHPNIMKIYGLCIRMLDQTTFSLYVLMEISQGDWDSDIKNHLKKKKNYSEAELINILRQLANALLFMQQELKISHRDIKPQNILVFKNDIYKISYTGLKTDNKNIHHDPYKSDVFSLGFCFIYSATLNFKLLYQLREVYNNEQMNHILKKELRKRYSDSFIDLLSHMMEIDERKRYSFNDLIDYIDTNYDQKGNLRDNEEK